MFPSKRCRGSWKSCFQSQCRVQVQSRGSPGSERNRGSPLTSGHVMATDAAAKNAAAAHPERLLASRRALTGSRFPRRDVDFGVGPLARLDREPDDLEPEQFHPVAKLLLGVRTDASGAARPRAQDGEEGLGVFRRPEVRKLDEEGPARAEDAVGILEIQEGVLF